MLGLLCVLLSKAQLNYSFSSASGTYTPLSGGTNPTLTAAQSISGYTAPDEGYANSIPIGFTFNYDGTNYTTISINTNGFASFSTFSPVADPANETYLADDLEDGPYGPTLNRPVVAPLWADLAFANATEISYTTTGSAPNRVFTIEWKNAKWNSGAAGPVISVQLKLYETTNIIEFIYQQESTNVNNGSASIGIAGTAAGDFISVADASGSAASNSVAINNISARPATGQIFRFTPLSCGLPTGLKLNAATHNSLGFQWNTVSGATGYEYALTTSSTPPASGTPIATTSGAESSLQAATLYYLHVRGNCSGNYSPWVSAAFYTTCAPSSVVYYETFNNGTPPAVPICIRVDDANNDGTTWYTDAGDGATIPTGNIRYTKNSINTTMAADDWFFIGPFSLTTGQSYNLNFRYKGSDGPALIEQLEVKYGTTPFALGMTSAAIFSNTNINSASTDPYSTGTATVTVPSNGNYFIGFHVLSIANQASLYVDDVQLSGGTLPVSFTNFTGHNEGSKNILKWSTSSEINNKGFEVERSADGKSFSKIAFVASKSESGNSTVQLSYGFTDEKPFSGTNYYRLKQMDKDGKVMYSDVVVLKNKIADFKIANLYPNPARSEVKMIITATNAGRATIVISDLTGKIISQLPVQLAVGENNQTIKVQSLANGTYLIKVIAESGLETVQRFVKH